MPAPPRSALSSIGQKAQADWRLTSGRRGLFAVAEDYPPLKANQNFLGLQMSISELEERIARELFNDEYEEGAWLGRCPRSGRRFL